MVGHISGFWDGWTINQTHPCAAEAASVSGTSWRSSCLSRSAVHPSSPIGENSPANNGPAIANHDVFPWAEDGSEPTEKRVQWTSQRRLVASFAGVLTHSHIPKPPSVERQDLLSKTGGYYDRQRSHHSWRIMKNHQDDYYGTLGHLHGYVDQKLW